MIWMAFGLASTFLSDGTFTDRALAVVDQDVYSSGFSVDNKTVTEIKQNLVSVDARSKKDFLQAMWVLNRQRWIYLEQGGFKVREGWTGEFNGELLFSTFGEPPEGVTRSIFQEQGWTYNCTDGVIRLYPLVTGNTVRIQEIEIDGLHAKVGANDNRGFFDRYGHGLLE